MTLQEIESKKAELRNKINEAKNEQELEELRKQVEELNKEVPEAEKTKGAITREEERALIVDTENLEQRKVEIIGNLAKMEDKKMVRTREEVLKSPEYRTAWAKKLMKLPDSRFTEEEKRALGDAITTTDTTFVQSATETQGINNGGLFIPTTVRNELLEIITKQSPIYRDVRKLQVAGNIDLPYLFEADDAEWYGELIETKNEGQEYRNLQLTGWELAKDIVITWKLEEMAVDSFINFILEELANKMGKALVNAIIYGDGNDKPTGITKDLSPVKDGETPIDNIIETYKTLSDDDRIGAKAYISSSVNIEIVGYKDKNGNYPFLQGISATNLVSIEQDPYLKNNDILVGNCRNYILNEVTPVRVERERTVKGRKVTYGGYAMYDGKPKPKAFAYGQYTKREALV